MALAKEDIEQIHLIVREDVTERLLGQAANVRYELDLRERTIRVEEELKHQRELMLEGFKQMEKRFEQMEKRFEQIDKRFEQVDKRFEQVDKRFEQVAKHLELMQAESSRRFEQIDKRFEQMQAESNKRFEALTSRIDNFMIWTFATTLTVGGLVVTAIKYLP